MRLGWIAVLWALIFWPAWRLFAQDLAPRAYVITPIRSNAVTLTSSFYHGGVNFNGSVPVTDATGTYMVPVFSYYHALSFFGRFANVTVSLPYAVGTFRGNLQGTKESLYRSGLADSTLRFSVNLIGGPAMPAKEFAKWKQKRLLGASVKLLAPSGQYSSTKLINWGLNRWALKPEVGYSERWGHWLLDAYAGVWFYTTNPAFFSASGREAQTEAPIGSFEGHFSHDFKPRMWASLDANFWFGGTTTVNGIRNLNTRQSSSRLGGTVSLPVTKHQSIKLSYSGGTYVRFGGNYHNLQVAWQYAWVGGPR